MQVIRNLVTHGMSARAALAAPRLHDMAIPDKTQLERSSDRGGRVRGWSEEMARGLQGRGHVVEWIDSEYESGGLERELVLVLARAPLACPIVCVDALTLRFAR